MDKYSDIIPCEECGSNKIASLGNSDDFCGVCGKIQGRPLDMPLKHGDHRSYCYVQNPEEKYRRAMSKR